MSRPPADATPRVKLTAPPSEAAIHAVLPELTTLLAPWLSQQRWFGEKARPIANVSLADSAIAAADGGYWLWLLTDVGFADGGASRYLIPLAAMSEPAGNATPIASLDATDQQAAILDALTIARFRESLLDQLRDQGQIHSLHGTFQWQATTGQAHLIEAAASGSSHVSAVEQSNSSIVYDESLILKLFRKIQPGINPEIEIGRFLTEGTAYRHIPALVGSLSYVAGQAEPVSLAVAQAFVPNLGDGWSFTLRSLEQAMNGDMSSLKREEVLDQYSAAAERLGRRTGQLHAALASARGESMRPAAVTGADITAWRDDTRHALIETSDAVAAKMPHVGPATRQLLDRFQAAVPSLEAWAAGFTNLANTLKIRVHGDYHLGQTLRTPDDDFVILDFEGEPARSLAERRAKTSALKDVAGMLRSFTYARGAAAHALTVKDEPPEAADWLADWERQARNAFIAGYRAETTAHGVAFLPANRADFDAALAAWELDKALYEIRYELNNRPDWLTIALTGLI